MSNILDYLLKSTDFSQLPGDQRRQVAIAKSNVMDLLRRLGKHHAADAKKEWTVFLNNIEIPVREDKLEGHSPTMLFGFESKVRDQEVHWQSVWMCLTFTSARGHVRGTRGRMENVNSCCLDRYAGKKRIVRRFHFDFQPYDEFPASHLQYGGKFKSGDVGDCHYCLEHTLDRPRVHFPPMDLLLVLDLFMRQFQIGLKIFGKDKGWIELLKCSETTWWTDYFKDIAGHFNRTNGVTIQARLYGEC